MSTYAVDVTTGRARHRADYPIRFKQGLVLPGVAYSW
jgi:hypothetical protein